MLDYNVRKFACFACIKLPITVGFCKFWLENFISMLSEKVYLVFVAFLTNFWLADEFRVQELEQTSDLNVLSILHYIF